MEESHDPTSVTQYIEALRSMAAEVSLGRVSATANGYGFLTRLRIDPEMYSDPERLGRLISRAVNAAVLEADRRIPPLRSPFDNPFGPTILPPPQRPTPACYGGALIPGERAEWRIPAPGKTEAQRAAYIDGAYVVRQRVANDYLEVEDDLQDLLAVVYRHFARPGLNARFVRRTAGSRDPGTLEWFRAELRVSLTEYIRRRRLETAARMIYRSDLTLDELASMLDFRDARALSSAIKRWCGRSPSDLRYYWERVGVDYVLYKWMVEGTASIGQKHRIEDDLRRLEVRLKGGEPLRVHALPALL